MRKPVRAIDFELTADYVELNQLLKLAGLCDSGGAGKALVATGKVSVDGVPESRKRAKIRAGQVVHCEDVRIVVKAAGSGLRSAGSPEVRSDPHVDRSDPPTDV